MSTYALSHLSDPALVRALHTLVAQDRSTTASLLAHLAEVDERRLYAPAGYPSMFAYCVGELRLAEDAACKRIQAARTARRFPAIFPALAEGRLNLTGVLLLGPYLTPANAADLLAAAAGESKAGIELLLAERFPRTELLPLVQALPAAPGPGAVSAPERIESSAGLSAPERIDMPEPRSKLTPTAPERFALQVSIGKETHELLCYARALLGHSVPSGDLAAVLHHVLKLAVPQLEQGKFGATDRPRRVLRPSNNPRHIPAAVRRAVWERDGGRCTFVSADGHRCEARTRLEFDHVEPVAKGGKATVEGVRLRCRAHNQYAAEQAFGAGFMAEKRREAQEARGARVEASAGAQEAAESSHGATEPALDPTAQAQAAAEREQMQARARAESERARQAAMAAQREQAQAAERERAAGAARARAAEEVVPYLRALGIRAEAAREAALARGSDPDMPLDKRVKAALTCFGRRPEGRAA